MTVVQGFPPLARGVIDTAGKMSLMVSKVLKVPRYEEHCGPRVSSFKGTAG
jgi:hypothetical protein